MKKSALILIFLIILFVNANAQIKLKLSCGDNYRKDSSGTLSGKPKKTDSGTYIIAAIILLPGPELLAENKKVYFGLTKEISAGIYPFGRLAFEYTYIFRSYDRNHFRISYNYDFITETNSYVALWLSLGLGYFTDTRNKGFFPQFSGAILIPLDMRVLEAVYPYVKTRYTFVRGQGNSNIFDFSLGIGFLLHY